MEIAGYSKVKKYKVVFKWEIDCLPSFIVSTDYDKTDKSLESPRFSSGARFNDSWFLELKVDFSKQSKTKGWISLGLNLADSEIPETTVEYLFYVLNKNNEKCAVQEPSSRNFRRLEEWGYSQFIKINELLENKENYLSNDILTVCIELSVHDNYVSVINELPSKTSKRPMVDDLKILFDSKVGSDVTLIVGSQKILAHKALLMVRSPVFHAMFTHQMQEKKENKIKITDTDPEILNKMLEFIYTDQVSEIDQYAEDLFEAADMYQLQTLQILCEESLCKSITVNNAIRYLEIADRQSACQFYEYVLRFIAINAQKVIESEDFKAIEGENSPLLSVILNKVCSI